MYIFVSHVLNQICSLQTSALICIESKVGNVWGYQVPWGQELFKVKERRVMGGGRIIKKTTFFPRVD